MLMLTQKSVRHNGCPVLTFELKIIDRMKSQEFRVYQIR